MIPKPPKRGPKPRKHIPRRGRKRLSKRRKSRLQLRKECDRRFAVAVKQRDAWACRACGSPFRIQCAHIVSRRYHATRWMLGNAVALCAKCHMKYTMDPLGWDLWVEDRIGCTAYQELKRIARQGVAHVDYQAVLDSLPEVE